MDESNTCVGRARRITRLEIIDRLPILINMPPWAEGIWDRLVVIPGRAGVAGSERCGLGADLLIIQYGCGRADVRIAIAGGVAYDRRHVPCGRRGDTTVLLRHAEHTVGGVRAAQRPAGFIPVRGRAFLPLRGPAHGIG